MHLAQLNIARLKYDLEDPRVADFVNNLDRINALAARSPGFVWQLKDETGGGVVVQAFDDPRVVDNLTVWETPEALEKFVWQTVHKQIYARRAEWFSMMDKMHFAMWWVEPGHEPSIKEARERLEHLQQRGDSDYAFGWQHLPNVQMWKEARCA